MSRRWQGGRMTRGPAAPPRPRAGLAVPLAILFAALSLGVLGGVLLYAAGAQPVPPAAQGEPIDSRANRAAATPIVVVRAATPPPVAPAATLQPTRAPAQAVTAAQTATPEATEQPAAPTAAPTPSAGPTEDPRVEAALQRLASDEDRVGQLLMLGWPEAAENARDMVRGLRPGAIVHIGNARTARLAASTNAELAAMAQRHGALPPLLAVDHEGGRVQRVQDIENVGANWDFGLRAPSDRQACERGRLHAQQLRDMGFTMNLAPVLDVNNNPANPVIGSRSYGADPELVARLGSAYVRGLQGGGIAAVGKHFPGHGNTSVDSHLSLPVLPHSLDELERVELAPFRRAVDPVTGVAAIMSAHIGFPALDPSGAPATLSHAIMTSLLRQRLGFDGLVLSDDMGVMKAITDNFTPGEAAVRAVAAGVDMLIIAGPLDRQVASRDALVTAVQRGELSRERIEGAVRRVLRAKARFGLLGEPAPISAGCE